MDERNSENWRGELAEGIQSKCAPRFFINVKVC